MPLFDTDSESLSSGSSRSSRRPRQQRLEYSHRQRRPRSADEEYAENVRPAIISMVTRQEEEAEGEGLASTTMKELQTLLNASAFSYEDLMEMAKRDDYMMLFESAILPSRQEEARVCENYASTDYCFACDAINLECFSKIKDDIEKIIVAHNNNSMHAAPIYTVQEIYEVYEREVRKEKNEMIEKQILKEMSRKDVSVQFINNLEKNMVPEWKKSAICKHYFTAEHSLQTEITLPYLIRDLLRQYDYFSQKMFVKHPAAPNQILYKQQLPKEARETAKLIANMYKDFFFLRQIQTGESTKRQKIIGKKPGDIMSGQNVEHITQTLGSDSVLSRYFNL